jgi:hypothetical protein
MIYHQIQAALTLHKGLPTDLEAFQAALLDRAFKDDL